MDKRGQFYIVASILIVMALFGMTTISTYAVVKAEPRTISELAVDLDRESYKIIEYGIYKNENITLLIEDFTAEDIAKYFLKKTNDANIVFVYGNKSEMYSVFYESLKTGSIIISGSNVNLDSKNRYSKIKKLKSSDFVDDPKDGEDDFVKIKVLETDYFFDLKNNEMFYFVIAKKEGEDVFVERNDPPAKENRPGGEKRKTKPSKK